MALQGSQVTVGDTATSILAAGVAGAWATVTNAGGASVFLGGASVATTDGYELAAGSTIEVNLNSGDELFGIVAAGTTEDVHVISA